MLVSRRLGGLLAALLALGWAGAPDHPVWPDAWLPDAGAVPDEATAVSIAVAVLNGLQPHRYDFRPADFRAELREGRDGYDVWVVRERPDFVPPGALGGLPVVFIGRRDGRILDIVRME